MDVDIFPVDLCRCLPLKLIYLQQFLVHFSNLISILLQPVHLKSFVGFRVKIMTATTLTDTILYVNYENIG